MKKILFWGLGIVTAMLVVIQFVPYGRDHTNPPVVAEPQWDSPKTRERFMKACGDCHSNETKWPMYSNIAPFSWLIQYDVVEGRKVFNVSMWGVQEENEGEDAAEEVQEGEMPPWFYLPTHPEAKFTDAKKQEFIRGLVATFGEDDEYKHDD
jgi:mono/diheme cytochrome c family protein